MFSECRDFVKQEWTKRGDPSRKQIENILKKGARKDSPNFVTWFRSLVMFYFLFNYTKMYNIFSQFMTLNIPYL